MAKKAAKKAAKKPAKAREKRPSYRLKEIGDEQMSAVQKSLRDAIYSGPRGIRKKLTGPFQIWLQRAGARTSRAGGRRACALQDLAVAAAVGDRDHRPPRITGRRITSGRRTRSRR